MTKKQFALFTALCFFALPSTGRCAPLHDDPRFPQAQQFLSHENYEEALVLFSDLCRDYPQSSETAFYLGITYKRMQDYTRARPFLEDACRFEPPFEDAVPELIELLYQYDKADEALEWVGRAERMFVAPAQVAYLKGLVLLKKNRPQEAIKAFDDAQRLDPSLGQSVAYQKGVALSRKRDYAAAREQLRGVVVKDPSSDLAVFASEYIDSLKRQQDAERVIKANLSYSLQYDDNVMFKPTDSSLASDITDESDWLQVVSSQIEWTAKPPQEGEFALNTVYSFYGSHHNDIGLYDVQSHDISVQPAYYSGQSSYALPIHYDYVTLNEDPYLDTIGAGAIFNFSPVSERMWQLEAQFDRQDYRWAVVSRNDSRDGNEFTLSAGHFWFRDASGYLNLRYALDYYNARGSNWDYLGHRLIFTSVVPLTRTLQWDFVADYLRQDFSHVHAAFGVKRTDDILTLSNLLVKELNENIQVNLQHTLVIDSCNIGMYKYRKNTFSLGIKYKF